MATVGTQFIGYIMPQGMTLSWRFAPRYTINCVPTKRLMRFLFGLALLFIPALNAEALEAFTPSETMNGAFIGKYVEHYADPTKQLTLADIRKDSYESQFVPVNRDTLDFGMSDAAHWIHLTVNNPGSGDMDWIMQAEHSLLNHIEVYEVRYNGEVTFHEGGTQIPFNKRDIAYRKNAFSMITPPGVSGIYIKVWPKYRAVANCSLTVWGNNKFLEKNSIDTLLLGLYYGALLAMCLYNLFIFFSVRDTVYLTYVAYIAVAGLSYFAMNGLAFQYLWPGSIYMGMHGPLGFGIFSFALAIFFSRTFLNTKALTPSLDKILLAIALFCVFDGVLTLVEAKSYPYSISMGYFSTLIFPPLLLYAGIRCMMAGVRQARFYIVAWTLYLAGTMLYFLKDFGVLPYSFVTAYSIQIGTLADVILLSFALADRIKILRGEKEAAQSRMIAQEQRALKIAEDARGNLEKEVAERTAQLAESETRFRRFSDATFEGIVIHDNGIIIDLNEEAARMMGYEPAELIGKNGLELLFPSKYGKILEEHFRNGTEDAFEAAGIRKDGSPIHLELRGRTVAYQGRDVLISAVRDITERKKAEKEKQEALDRLEKIASRVPGIVYQFRLRPDGSSCVPYASDAAREIYRLDPDEMRSDASKTFARVHPEDLDGYLASILASARDMTPWKREYRLKFDNEPDVWLFGNAIPQREADGSTLWHGFVTDITENKRAELELRQAKEQAENATRLKDKFVSLVTHDLKSPLGSLAIGLETLSNDDDLAPGARQFVGKMAAHSRELLNMTERLLDISRLQTGRIIPQKRFINCRHFAAAQIGLYQTMASQKEIAIVNNLPGAMKIYADPDLFGECVKNVLSNALKFCGKGDTVTFFNPPDMPSTIAVKDNGPGIDPKIMPSLFKAEMKTRNFGTAGEKGTGIGLPHAQEIMIAHDGTIAVESEPGKGSVLFLVLPHTFNATVLVVDDQEVVRAAIREHCADIFPGILEAGNGAEALEIIKNVTPHLIITDINMPMMNGLEFIQQMRSGSLARRVPIIAMTSDESLPTPNGMDIRSYCLHIGADDFVNKPVAANDLVPRITRLISSLPETK